MLSINAVPQYTVQLRYIRAHRRGTFGHTEEVKVLVTQYTPACCSHKIWQQPKLHFVVPKCEEGPWPLCQVLLQEVDLQTRQTITINIPRKSRALGLELLLLSSPSLPPHPSLSSPLSNVGDYHFPPGTCMSRHNLSCSG